MNKKIKFSVIIPLYNKQEYIAKTIYSVLEQSYKEFELVIVNDGSTDKSIEIVNQIVVQVKHPEIKVINISNKGVANARNIGILRASGEYIAFLDADDIWERDYLKNVHANICEYPNASFYCSKYIVKKKNNNTYSSDIGEDGKIGTYWELLKYKYDVVWTSATVIKKEILINAGLFSLQDEVGEDLGLWLRVAKINPYVIYSSKAMVYYLRDAENNARMRTKLLYPSEFLSLMRKEIEFGNYTQKEKDAMSYKYDKKMYVYIFSLITNNCKKEANDVLNEWNNKYFGCYKLGLRVLSCLPDKINKHIYKYIVSNS